MNDKDKEAYGSMTNTNIILTRIVENEVYYSEFSINLMVGIISKLEAENKELREALIECPIVGEIHRDSNDRFKEWNLIHRNTIREALKETAPIE